MQIFAYFSAARSHSQATLDSLDISRFSEDGADEKVAVLEFELRKAKENISGLRATLTQMTAGLFGNLWCGDVFISLNDLQRGRKMSPVSNQM
jgi:hypothetical protein